MVGSGMVALPWAFYRSGIILGCVISFTSFVISYYTCSLIIKTAKNDTDYVFTLKKLYGMKGFYMGLLGPTILIFGAITVYFVVIVQSLYPLLFVLFKNVFHLDMGDYIDPTKADNFGRFDAFSAQWVGLGIYFLLVLVCMKKDLSFFIKFGSFGAVCVSCLILFVIGNGIWALTNTDYEFVLTPKALTDDDKQKLEISNIWMFNGSFSSLAGVLCAGYYLHQFSIPITSNAANPETKLRDVFIGYSMVYISYTILGVLGYLGFSGHFFRKEKYDLDNYNIKIE